MLVCCQTIQKRTRKTGLLKVEKISIIDQVIQQLETSITSGEYTVGQKMPSEVELCRTLGVGRSTVREAYRMLQAFGMIELRPGKGAFVNAAVRNSSTNEAIRDWFIEKKAELSDLMEVRMAVEPLAVKLAIKKGTREQIEHISALNKKFQEAAKRLNVVELVELDENFHTAIVEASNNALLIKINQLIAETFKAYRTRSFAVSENVEHASDPHNSILDAILQKNEAMGIQAMNDHLVISMLDIEKVVGKD
jgi:GntR family transcriptional regulator, transcriptional repressor for pyruvate dehydrogenase complex